MWAFLPRNDITLHLVKESGNCQLVDQCSTAVSVDWSISQSWYDLMREKHLASSANTNILQLSLKHHSIKSFINIIKSNGPKTEPWGTPLVTGDQSE